MYRKLACLIWLLPLMSVACASRQKPLVGVEKYDRPASFVEKLEGKQQTMSVFSTPFGEIEQGAPMSTVMNVLGNPHDISHEETDEVWHYYLGATSLDVFFTNGKVVEVKELEDAGSPGQ